MAITWQNRREIFNVAYRSEQQKHAVLRAWINGITYEKA